MFFDFHNHSVDKVGIYNLNLLEIPNNHPFSIGFHPKDLNEIEDEHWEWFKKYSKHPSCVMIGECGLDGIVLVEEEKQEYFLLKQIQCANELNLPIVLHCVRRFSQLLKFSKSSKVPLIIHGFNKKESIAMELLNKGFFLSFGKAAFNNLSLQETIKKVPLDKMLLESDDDDFDIKNLYEIVANIKNISIKTLQDAVEETLLKINVL